MSIRISNISMSNFKLFDDFSTNIDNEELILFDGPNGYGKTSVFDAIELALTKDIKRISKNAKLFSGSNSYKNYILIKDETKEAEVSVTLVNGDNKLKVVKKYLPQYLGKLSKEKNPQKIFDHFESIYELNDKLVLENELDSVINKFGLKNIAKTFSKCFYLSQDDHLEVLRNNDQSRVSTLDFLFNTKSEDDEIKKLNSINTKYTKILNTYNTDLEKLNNELNTKKKKISEEKDSVKFRKLFQKIDVTWDVENYIVNDENYNKILTVLDNLIYISNNKLQCVKYIKRYNNENLFKEYCDDINKITMKDYPLQYTINYYKKIGQYDNINALFEKQQKLLKEKKNIDNKEYKSLNLEEIKKIMNYSPLELVEVKKYINTIEEKRKNEGTLSAVISDLNDTRGKIMKTFDNKNLLENLEDHICPLCGYNWKEKKELLNSIEVQKQKLTKLCSDDTLAREKIEKEFYDKYIENIYKKIQEETKELIDSDYVLKLKEACEYKEKMDKIIKDLKNDNIIIDDKIKVTGYIDENNYLDLIKLIKKVFPECTAEIRDKLDDINLKRYYDKYFNKDIDELNKISTDTINEKKKYIEYLYYNAISKEIISIDAKVKSIKSRFDKLDKIIDRLKEYEDAKSIAVEKYKKSIIKDIEPLLYVYCAKIIQQKFGGKSVLISNDKLKNLKFVSNSNNDQDIIHSMSSGQLTSVSLAFLLCMNKVYNANRFNVLLIDDPLQTVDDVNMVGFVDLIRHEFSDIQIIISTHEKDFANYIAYKFIKAGYSYKNYNMRKIMLHESNKVSL